VVSVAVEQGKRSGVTPALEYAYRAQHKSIRAVSRGFQELARRVVFKQKDLGKIALEELTQSFDALLDADVANAERGVYPWSLLFQLPFSEYARVLPKMARDFPKVVKRMQSKNWQDLPEGVDSKDYPAYYRRNFHWQSDGYLSEHSAELYDLMVEVLFGGVADVMRRQVIPPLVERRRRVSRPLELLDVASGTGRTALQVLKTLPDTHYTGIDLSPFYAEHARRRLKDFSNCRTFAGNAEQLPFEPGSFDAIFSVYLFHELPRAVRRTVYSEMLRVLRPGGVLVVLDSIQNEDSEAISLVVDRFSAELHEPYYAEYLTDPVASALEETGFRVQSSERFHVSKRVVAFAPETSARQFRTV